MIKTGNSRKYINKNIGRIRRMFKWGVAKQLVPVTSYQALLTVDGLKKGKTAAKEMAPIMPVAEDLVEATLKHCRPIIAEMVKFQQLTGCRPANFLSCDPRTLIVRAMFGRIRLTVTKWNIKDVLESS